jgi:hypothetical protein
MRRSFIFDVRQKIAGLTDSHFTVVHCGPAELNDIQLRADLVDYFDAHDHLPPDRILLLGTESSFESLRALSGSETIRSSIPEFTRNSNPPPVSPLCLGRGGPSSIVNELADRQFVAAINRQGLWSLFRRREAILKGGEFVHYVKPSEKHCEKFIRAANVLVRSTDVEFLGFCLLEYIIRLRPRYIYADTAAISMVAYSAVIQMRQLDPTFPIPIVDSFSSHAGVRHYEFEQKDKSLFLISASTSGDLEGILTHEMGVLPSNVVTLFYLGEKRAGSQILCDVSKRPDNPEGWIDIVKSYPSTECPLCDRGLRVVQIVGDQFLTSRFEVLPELITVRCKPDWLEPFVSDLAGSGVLSCHRLADSSEERPRELFVDLTKLYRARLTAQTRFRKGTTQHTPKLLVRLDRLLSQVTPASVSQIIFLRNSSSKALALRIVRLLRLHNSSKRLRVVPAHRVLRAAKDELGSSAGTVMVVAGAVVAGQQLMEVSQALRFQKSAVTYFAGLLRTRDTSRREEICSNLRQGGQTFNYLTEIYIPDDPFSRPSPWDREVVALRNLRRRVQEIPPCQQLVRDRIRSLETAKARTGLSETLFWPSICGKTLKLRPNFAFWKFDYSQRLHTQADVYFTVSAVLHAWRARRSEDTGSDSKRLLLAPRNFVRFNDGVIQSSLLRSSMPGELDYRENKEQSELMASVLDVVFQNCEDDRGEACIEFLLAVLEGRLRLVKKDIYKRVEDLQPTLATIAKRSVIAEFGYHLCAAILDNLDKEG